MSKKQEIYRKLLHFSMPIVRNVLSSRVVYGKSRKNAFYLAQLTHDLHISMWEDDFVSHDFWFLNVHARDYCEAAKGLPSFDTVEALIKELFKEVPKSMRHKLEWQGP